MTLLMTAATVLAATILLSVLAVGLLLIVKALQSVRGYLEQVAMGVRAIEIHVRSLPGELRDLEERLAPLSGDVARASQRLGDAGRALEADDTRRTH